MVNKFRAVLRIFERELDFQNNSCCCCGITLSQCHVLMELSIKDNLKLGQLSEKLSLDKSAVSRTVEILVNKGLVIREIPENNRRTTIVRLSSAGQAVSRQIHASNNEYYLKALGAIQPDNLHGFLRAFEDLAHGMHELNRIPGTTQMVQ